MKIVNYTIEPIKLKDIKMLPFNRKISIAQADKLLTSIANYGILRLPVVIKAKLNHPKVSYWLADGQHLCAALTKADQQSVQCLILEVEDLSRVVNIMASLNNVNLRWVLDDYVDAYSALCNKEYEKLKMHKYSTGLTCAISAMILGEAEISSVKKGKFKANAKDADKLTSELIDVISFLGTGNSKFMKAFIKFRRSQTINYDHKLFMQKLAQNKSNIKLVHDEAAMRQTLEAVYK
jgi:hypothetical protein